MYLLWDGLIEVIQPKSIFFVPNAFRELVREKIEAKKIPYFEKNEEKLVKLFRRFTDKELI